MMNRRTKTILIFPILITWDAFYFLIKQLTRLCDYIDIEGAKIIDKILENDR